MLLTPTAHFCIPNCLKKKIPTKKGFQEQIFSQENCLFSIYGFLYKNTNTAPFLFTEEKVLEIATNLYYLKNSICKYSTHL